MCRVVILICYSGGICYRGGFMTIEMERFLMKIWKIACNFFLIAPFQRVQLTITSLEIEFHSRCIYDALYIYDGPSNRHNVLRIMCGSSKQVRVTSSASYMYVSFITNENNVDRGFEASFVGVDRVHTTPTSTLSTIWNVTPTPPRGPSVDDHNSEKNIPIIFLWPQLLYMLNLNINGCIT